MPKLPEQKKSNILEVADKSEYNRGELTVARPPRHYKVLIHHLKISALLAALCVLLGIVFLLVKPVFLKQELHEEETPVSEVEQFKEPSEAILNYPNLEYSTGMIVDRVDGARKVIYGKKMNPETGEFTDIAVRVLDQTEISSEQGRGESSSTAQVKTLVDIKTGNLLLILATEDPGTNQYLNARNIVIR